MTVVLALLDGDRARGANLPQAVAAKAALALGVDGVCAGLGTGPSGLVLAWGHEAVSTELEDLQFTLGQGPGLDAAAGSPVLIADLAAETARWPVFAPAAAALGVRAVFALPLRIGAISVGALLAHRATPGRWSTARSRTLSPWRTRSPSCCCTGSRPTPTGPGPPGTGRSR